MSTFSFCSRYFIIPLGYWFISFQVECVFGFLQDVPYIFNVEWSMNSRLKDLVQQFQEVCYCRLYCIFLQLFISKASDFLEESLSIGCLTLTEGINYLFVTQQHLEKLQEFWATLDDIDNSLCVVNLKQTSRAVSFRQMDIGKTDFNSACTGFV